MTDPDVITALRRGIRDVVNCYPDVNAVDKVRALRDVIAEWEPPFASSAHALGQRLWEVIVQEKNRETILHAMTDTLARVIVVNHRDDPNRVAADTCGALVMLVRDHPERKAH
jgi:hypothetical protein